MTALINLVATRSKNGDHDALFRWYSDHVHLLLGFDALRRATLYRRIGAALAGGPEYLCLYEFPSQADFLAFESSAARARAQQVVETGWARDGIEIVQRTQYLRLGQRSGNGLSAAQGGVHQIQTVTLGAGPLPGVARWLADRLHQTLRSPVWGDVAWHRSCDATHSGGEALLMAEASLVDAAVGTPLADGHWLTDPAVMTDAVGDGPDAVTLRWQGAYQRLCGWAH